MRRFAMPAAGPPASRARGADASSQGGGDASPETDTVRRLRLKNRQLEEDLAALVVRREEVYARKVSDAEKQCAQRLAERDESHRSWQERHVQELDEMRAAVQIMHWLWLRKVNRLSTEGIEQRSAFERKFEDKDLALRRAQAEQQAEVQRLGGELARGRAEHEAREQEHSQERAALEERGRALERQLAAKQKEVEGLQAAQRQQQREVQQLQQQLQQSAAEARRLEEVLKRDTRVKAMQKEKDLLEREVQDYVRFIVDQTRLPSPEMSWGESSRLSSALRASPGRTPGGRRQRPMGEGGLAASPASGLHEGLWCLEPPAASPWASPQPRGGGETSRALPPYSPLRPTGQRGRGRPSPASARRAWQDSCWGPCALSADSA